MLLSSLFPLISGISALFFLKETLPANLHEDNEQASAEDKSLKKLMTRHISLIIFSFGVLSLLGVGIGALLPLFCFTPVDHGGLGFNAKTIGSVISQRSVAVLIIQMVAFPWFQKRVGTTRLFKWLMILWIPTMLLLPLCNLAARMGNDLMLWIGLYLFMLVGSLAGMAFGESSSCPLSYSTRVPQLPPFCLSPLQVRTSISMLTLVCV
jgi:Na+/melibiose symporter-like transporter